MPQLQHQLQKIIRLFPSLLFKATILLWLFIPPYLAVSKYPPVDNSAFSFILSYSIILFLWMMFNTVIMVTLLYLIIIPFVKSLGFLKK